MKTLQQQGKLIDMLKTDKKNKLTCEQCSKKGLLYQYKISINNETKMLGKCCLTKYYPDTVLFIQKQTGCYLNNQQQMYTTWLDLKSDWEITTKSKTEGTLNPFNKQDLIKYLDKDLISITLLKKIKELI